MLMNKGNIRAEFLATLSHCGIDFIQSIITLGISEIMAFYSTLLFNEIHLKGMFLNIYVSLIHT